MLSSRPSGLAPQLKDSYIAISTYVRRRYCQPFPKLRRNFTFQAGGNAELQETSPTRREDETPAEGRQQPVCMSNKELVSPVTHYKNIFELPSATWHWCNSDPRPDRTSTMHGYITSARRGAKQIDFVDFVDPQLRNKLQLVVNEDIVGHDAREEIRKIRPHSPVAVSGQLLVRDAAKRASGSVPAGEEHPATSGADGLNIVYQSRLKTILKHTQRHNSIGGGVHTPAEFQMNPYVGEVAVRRQIEMVVESVRPLNHFPQDIIARVDTNFSSSQRHLQLRTNSGLRKTLQARSKAQTECRKYLFVKGFDEIETPILFKSTPEGAREFLVPSRQKGLAYALPQSPQQFKQILMASGISKYFQFARCFRDEDMRADRQPEFTQLDIEMSFACAEDVMKITERLIRVLWQTFFDQTIFQDPPEKPNEYKARDIPHDAPLYFRRMTYAEAMGSWGSDKPDTRLGSKIYQAQEFLDPVLKSQLSSLKDPIIDLMRVRATTKPQNTKQFIASFMDGPSGAAYLDNPHGIPGIFIIDSSKPMNGLSALGHDACEKVMQLVHPCRGDLVILQARPDQPFEGESSTMIGNLRRDLQMALVAEGIINKPRLDQFLWIIDFPLFSRTSETDVGQGGKAGIQSTHHPFTAPKTLSDLEKMASEPLKCTADHFDLVINGVEVGGGSRRIHDSLVQEMVLKDILKIPGKQVEEFRPLLEALRAGCPPHAGIALGFDRLMAIIRQTNTVRDVIAFPKSSTGEDRMFGAPSSIDLQKWAEYHMMPKGGDEGLDMKGKHEVAPRSKEVEHELGSVTKPTKDTPGSIQPDEGDISPSTPS